MMSLAAFDPGTPIDDIVEYYEEGEFSENKREDYYTEKGKSSGTLIGSGWARYGLEKGDYKSEYISRAFDGKDIINGELLIKGMTDKNGNPKRVPGFDMAFSNDKSVSIFFAAANEETKQKIICAQNRAVERAIKYVEDNLLLTNVGKGGKQRDQAKLFVSAYNHGSSRAGDPDLHTHCVLANFAERAGDGKIMSLNVREIFDRQKEIGAIYRSEMAEELKKIGFIIEKHGRDNEFMRIAGSPREIEKHYSKRRTEIENHEDQIQAAMEKYGVSRARASEYVALNTRHKKDEISIEDVKSQWHAELKEFGFDQSSIYKILEDAKNQNVDYSLEDKKVLDKVSNLRSVFSEKALRETFVNESVGILSVDEIEDRFKKLVASPEIISVYRKVWDEKKESWQVRTGFTTQEMIDIDQSMIDKAGELKTADTHKIDISVVDKHKSAFEAKKGFSLTNDQIQSLSAATIGSDFVIIEGHAGTGKTTAIEVAANAWIESGFNVRGCAPTGKATEGLEEAGIESETIAKLLLQNRGWYDDKEQWHDAQKPITNKDIIVVDEAGIVGSRDMEALLNAAHEAGAKVVLMGDRRQLQSVAAGGAMGALVKKYEVDASLVTVQRQKNEEVKSVVAAARVGDASMSLDILNEKGNLALVDDKIDGVDAVIGAWKKHYDHNSLRAEETSVMLANTNVDVEKLNSMARSHLKDTGALQNGKGTEFEVSDRNGISLGSREFLENDRIVFLANTKFENAAGEKTPVKNGQTGRIREINETSLTVDLTNGKQVKFDTREYNRIGHAYALTTHKSQGITVDHAAVLGGGFMQTLNQTYVQLSRVRNEVDVVLPKKDIEKAMALHEPTQKMLDFAAIIAEQKGHEVDQLQNMSFLECRNYLNDHSHYILNDHVEDDNARWRREIGTLIDKMCELDEKETTLDYEIKSKKIEQEQEQGHSPESSSKSSSEHERKKSEEEEKEKEMGLLM